MEKNLDSKGRWRNKLVGFRVSEEEAKLIDNCVALSGIPSRTILSDGCSAVMWWYRVIRECIRH